MHKSVRIEHDLVNEYLINHYYLVKKFICKYGRHEHSCVYWPKVEL